MPSKDTKQMGPLVGIRVLDMSRVLAGPWAGQVLADLGADVVKVERPERGDDTRAWGPPYLKTDEGVDTQESAYYLCANRGKRSIEVDITSAQGQQEIIELVKQSDVLIENFKVGGLAEYGLDYATLSKVNPKLIYCSITGFGQTGPRAQQAGYDLMIQAQSGLMSITGEPSGRGGIPNKVGVAITDITTGLYSVIAIQAALLERQITGQGKHIDMALLDCATALLANQASNFLVGGVVPERMGNEHPNIVPYQSFATNDGHIVVAVGNDQQFKRFCEVLGRERWYEDERFKSNDLRLENRSELIELIEVILAKRSGDEWLALFEEQNIPSAPINNIQQALTDPQLNHRDMIQDNQHPLSSNMKSIASPIKYVGEAKKKVAAAPMLGQRPEKS